MPKQKKSAAKSKANPVGRPSRYVASVHPKLVYHLAARGMAGPEIAAEIGIAEKTLYDWANKYPEFRKSLESGREDVDTKVENAMLQSALGYEHPQDKIMQHNGEPVIVPTIKRYPPNVTAGKFWLTNRKPDTWRDRQEVGVEGRIDTGFEDNEDGAREAAGASERFLPSPEEE